MNRIKLAIASLLVSGALAVPTVLACPGHGGKTAKEKKAANLKTASFRVDGMTCEGCASKVETALKGEDGIVKVSIKVEDKRITVDYDADKLTPEKIAQMITDLGYSASAEV